LYRRYGHVQRPAICRGRGSGPSCEARARRMNELGSGWGAKSARCSWNLRFNAYKAYAIQWTSSRLLLSKTWKSRPKFPGSFPGEFSGAEERTSFLSETHCKAHHPAHLQIDSQKICWITLNSGILIKLMCFTRLRARFSERIHRETRLQ
jgi:hypothetical protein